MAIDPPWLANKRAKRPAGAGTMLEWLEATTDLAPKSKYAYQ
jgi:hypothetical protein